MIADIYRSYKSTPVSEVIHPNDSMYKTGASHYYIVGESAIDVILPGLILSSISRVSRILDLACGYGRVARHLRAAFPQCELLFCDLVHEGAEFCASNFGGVTIAADADLTKIALPRDLDIIWIGSLFTHVDRVRTSNWLAFLADHLCEGGNIVATFHGYFSEKVTDFGERYDQAKQPAMAIVAPTACKITGSPLLSPLRFSTSQIRYQTLKSSPTRSEDGPTITTFSL